ncbi:hypothetical protein [Streptomyces sp. B8F3]|uniref:hypothetical protein n=1 Tax=unclassified Streptomyces TaxID=2593676 RepID=UPI00325CF24E
MTRANGRTNTAQGNAKVTAAKSQTKGKPGAVVDEVGQQTERAEEPLAEAADTGLSVSDRVGSLSTKAVSLAGATWKALNARRTVVLGTAAVLAVGVSAYAAGRRSGLSRRGPVSRYTGWRI